MEKGAALIAENAEAQRVAHYEATEAERDDLARHIRTRHAEIAAGLVSMVERINASNAHCDQANRKLPANGEKLDHAEHLSRESLGFYWEMQKGGCPVTYISQMIVPLLSRAGNYLPLRVGPGEFGYEQWQSMIAADQEFAAKPILGLDFLLGAEPQLTERAA